MTVFIQNAPGTVGKLATLDLLKSEEKSVLNECDQLDSDRFAVDELSVVVHASLNGIF